MRLRAEAKDPASVDADVLAVPIYREDDPFAADLEHLDAASGGAIRRAIEWGRFNILEDYFALIEGGDLPVEHILIVNGVRRGRGPWRARRMAARKRSAIRCARGCRGPCTSPKSRCAASRSPATAPSARRSARAPT